MNTRVWIGVVAATWIGAACSSGGNNSRESGFDPNAPTVKDGGLIDGSSSSDQRGRAAPSEPALLLSPDSGSGAMDAAPVPDGARDNATCAADARRAKQTPLDMVLLMDQSGSMGDRLKEGRKWDLLVAALTSFLRDPASAGMGIGLVYFGIPDGVDAHGDLAVSCRSTDYAQPIVPVSLLPESTPQLLSSLQAHTPIGGTPTRPALEGVSRYAETWRAQHPDHRVVVVLATDGEPNDCDSSIESVSALAGQAYQNDIPTYVVGVGKNLVNLDQIAARGGTGQAYMVDTASNVTQTFLSAMNAIRNAVVLPCQYALPSRDNGDAGGRLDLDRVNVAYSTTLARHGGAAAAALDAAPLDAAPLDAAPLDADGAAPQRGTTLFRQAPSAAACGSGWGEWYYDDPKAPTNIRLCPATCEGVKADLSGEVDILVGCQTIPIPVR